MKDLKTIIREYEQSVERGEKRLERSTNQLLIFCIVVLNVSVILTVIRYPRHEKKSVIEQPVYVSVQDVLNQMDVDDAAYVGNLIIDQYSKDHGTGIGALDQIFSTNNEISVVVGYINWRKYDERKLYEIANKYKGVIYNENK